MAVNSAAALTWVAVGSVGIWLVWRYLTVRYHRRMLAHFGLDPSSRVLGGDIGRLRPVNLQERQGRHWLVARPDLVARDEQGCLVVGEFKARHLKAGRVRDNEWYQVVLGAGLARKRFQEQGSVRCVLRFEDAVVEAPFDERLYQALVKLADELAVSLQRKRPVCLKSLRARQLVGHPGLELDSVQVRVIFSPRLGRV